MGIFFLRQAFEFCQIFVGSIQRPYQTFRGVSAKPNYLQLGFVALLIATYLILSTLAKDGLRTNPLFLTHSAVKAGLSISASFVLVSSLLYLIGRQFGGEGRISIFFLLWALTLLPTLCWFLLSTIFHVLIPPPRTISIEGQIFSAFFLGFSLSCFFWKGILYYLTLRVGLHLDALRIAIMSAITLPIGFLGSILLYRLGIFKVPFI